MSAITTIVFDRPRVNDGRGNNLSEGSDVPAMRARTGKRGADGEMVKLLASALEDLAHSPCAFWACDGPSRMIPMCTCVKCHAMRQIATVKASLEARSAK